MRIQVEHQGGRIFEVDVTNSICACRDPICTQFDFAKDILLNRGRRYRYEIISAVHKATRRSIPEEALNWAQVYCHISGVKNLETYCATILLEESRSLRLCRLFKETRDPYKKIAALIGVKKKWHLNYYREWFSTWLDAFKRFKVSPPIELDTFRKMTLGFSDLVTGYEVVFHSKSDPLFKQAFWEIMVQRAFAEQNVLLTELLQLKPKAMYDRILAAELCVGYWSDEADEIHIVPEWTETLTVVPELKPWIFDVHVRLGKQRFIESFPKLVSGNQIPKEVLDLEWSGQIWGVAHRAKYINLNDLKRSMDQVKGVIEFDQFFYARIYQKIRRTYPHLNLDLRTK